jgi:predicted N-acetyltransferase YhbS
MAILAPAIGPLLEQTLDATFPIWHDGLSRPAYGNWFAAQTATAWGSRHLTHWAWIEDERAVATAKVYIFSATLDGRPLRLAGLGAVFTRPDHRGRGHARDLMAALLERARLEGADAALLFSEIGPDYYARLGFESIPATDLTLRVLEDTRRGAPALMMRAGEERDLDNVVDMDAQRAAPYRFHLNRDRDLVHYAIVKKRILAGLGPSGARELLFFVAEEGAAAVAYVVISVSGGSWTIESCGDRDPAGARLGAILQVLIAREPSGRRPAIKGWLPPTLRPPQLVVDAAAPASDVMMMKPLSDGGRAAPALKWEEVLFWRGDAF